MTYTNLGDLFKGICDAIRAKKGTTGNINHQDIPNEIESIESGADVSGVTATVADVLSPKIFVDKDGVERTGTISTKTSSDVSVSGANITVPAGCYVSQVSKSVATGALSSPSISVSSSGVITATSGVSTAGYLTTSASKSNTKSLTTQAGGTYTLNAGESITRAAGTYLTSALNVSAASGGSGYIGSIITPSVSVGIYASNTNIGTIIISCNTQKLIGAFLWVYSKNSSNVDSDMIATAFIDVASNEAYVGNSTYIDYSTISMYEINIASNAIEILIDAGDVSLYNKSNIGWAMIPIYSS